MVSPNGAQSLDRPLGAIGHGNMHGNLSSNLRYSFNTLLKSVISNSIPEEMHHQNPSPSSSSSPLFAVGGGGGCDIPDFDDATAAIEDFLIRTGTAEVASQIVADKSQPVSAAQAPGAEWLQFQLAQPPAAEMAVNSGCYGGVVLKYEGSGLDVDGISISSGGVGYNSEGRVLLCGALPRSVSSESPAEEKRRRCSEDLKEKTIERKQKRMIKNRESAARSRARKQAHILRLVEEVDRLRKVKERLIKKKDAETKILSNKMSQKYQLRRINSARF